MARRSKIELADDPTFVKGIIRESIKSLSKTLEVPECAGHSEVIANSMVKLMTELLRPQVDELKHTFALQSQRLQVLEEQTTALYSMMGMRNLNNGPLRRQPNQPWPQTPAAGFAPPVNAPVYQGPSPEEIARGRA